jgi:hypothetical protein
LVCQQESPNWNWNREFGFGSNRVWIGLKPNFPNTTSNLLKQVDQVVDIFEGWTNGNAQGLFLFNNVPSHQKWAADAISAHKMPKCVSFLFPESTGGSDLQQTDPRKHWTHEPNGPCMHSSKLPTGENQIFYFPNDDLEMPSFFKGMEAIIREHRLWLADGLPAQCTNFWCLPGKTDCCCQRLLFSQPDFTDQKPHLQEFIERCGHLCDFYPKYHCKLNFIKQYWGAAKLWFWVMARAVTIDGIEENVIVCLNDIPLLQIQRWVSFFCFLIISLILIRFANQSAQFILAYSEGLTSAQAIWANRTYHGHCMLPPEMVEEIRQSVPT